MKKTQEWTSHTVNQVNIVQNSIICTGGPGHIKGPVQPKSMFISIDQLPKIIEFHTIVVQNYSSVDLIFEKNDMLAAILKNLKLL